MRGALRILGGASLVAVIWFLVAGHDFLAISEPVSANVLVVEGWVWHSAAMQEAVDEFQRGAYDVVITVGVISEGEASGRTQENDAASAAERLKELGLGGHAVAEVAVPHTDRHRTYASALAVKRWLTDSKINTRGINVFTLGTHARKSRVLFRRALGGDIPIGVIAGTVHDYNPERWWLSVQGTNAVLRKTAGFLYAVTWPLPA
jgi:hypothetical protein